MTVPETPSAAPSPLPAVIDELWERRAGLSPADAEARKLVVEAVDLLDTGAARVAQIDPATDEVVVDERAKRAILLTFKVLEMVENKVGDFYQHDKMPLKTTFDGVRVVPGAIARWGSYCAPGTILMPSFINIGGYVDSGTMIDAWATVGSCAQIGKGVHISGGAGIGGVLEPLQASPNDQAHVFRNVVLVEFELSAELPGRIKDFSLFGQMPVHLLDEEWISLAFLKDETD